MTNKYKTIIIAIGSILGIGTGFYLYNKFKKAQQTKSGIKSIIGGTNTQLGINIPEIASQIGIELGVAYPAYDPRHWTENDTVAKELVLKVPKPLIKTLISEYYKKYKRNLIDDLTKLLDGWNDVKYLFV